MADLFTAYAAQATGTKVHAYIIESTAPNNIDDVGIPPEQQDPHQIGADAVIDRIVNDLKNSENPTLVLSIHGFNNPRDIIIDGYKNSFNSVVNDPAINNKDIVIIGYRWPSERIGAPRETIVESATTFIKLSVSFGIIILIAALYLHFVGFIEHLSTFLLLTAGVFFALIPVTFILLRIVVYFRDGYRATAFGVPDLVEIIRQIDKKFADQDARRNQVQLSFVAHSMGAYVVTNAVRILSDVFSPASMREGLNIRPENAPASVPSEIGKAFRLKQLILVSPDIPAEALISSRANFLSSSLKRFEDAFLFSNEGDEVLRQISTTANYFSFPTKSNTFGYRLGNVCLLGIPSGISKGIDLRRLRIGTLTLAEIYNKMSKIGFGQLQDDLPKRFSYFDCTDCVENGKGMLTLAKPGHIKKIGHTKHLWLLIRYLWNRKPDVHGGYFRSRFLSELIFRLACIGRNDTIKAYGGEAELDKECKTRQVKVLFNS
ncbi:alpha/beta hydrolase [Methylocapsa sp. D3K7]|uniref:alpha/beta hydrolase n=1 Tax=Methylocapsa sp. D3K7 TaxID=3041435 RepID=UPI00244E6331|nr:alpha/beta hydrolase [Methylocapsa sp. D3K7]WGJ13336.1 alpha/beta hydrolase [Methylocapsa sp. D3K7]